ncbi:MAG: hypothetical protein OWQ54_07775 [Sulfolobaceae archaeon]|nr:hypothetical protein [Sulfolobaceae archaeon]
MRWIVEPSTPNRLSSLNPFSSQIKFSLLVANLVRLAIYGVIENA